MLGSTFNRSIDQSISPPGLQSAAHRAFLSSRLRLHAGCNSFIQYARHCTLANAASVSLGTANVKRAVAVCNRSVQSQ
jgi:hypothetical protein